MENIKKFPRGINSDQAISEATGTPTQQSVRPGPGLKPQAPSSKLYYTPTGILLGVDLGDKPQASSKPEPSSGSQASSDKPLSHKHRDQASSHKRQAP